MTRKITREQLEGEVLDAESDVLSQIMNEPIEGVELKDWFISDESNITVKEFRDALKRINKKGYFLDAISILSEDRARVSIDYLVSNLCKDREFIVGFRAMRHGKNIRGIIYTNPDRDNERDNFQIYIDVRRQTK